MALISRHRFPLADSDDAFLKTAPFRYEQSVETTAPAERIWEVLTGDDLVHWVPVWTCLPWGAPPLGVGTVREVPLAEVFTVRERFFFRWVEGRLGAFHSAAWMRLFPASGMWQRNVAEDWVIEPTPSGSRLTWTLALRAHRWAAPLVWLGSPIIRGVQRRVLRTIRVHVGN